MSIRIASIVLFAGTLFVTAAWGQGREDVAGGRDHALVSRYQGSWLIAFRQQPFAEVKPLSLLTPTEAGRLKLDKTRAVQGEVSELFYVSPRGRSALEVQTNYEDAFKQSGARLLYSCTNGARGCHDGGGPAANLLLNREVPLDQQVGGAYEAFGAQATHLRLAVFELTRAGVTTFITIYSVDSPPDSRRFGGSAATYLQIVQPKPMDTGKVTVFDAKQIAAGLAAEGKIALYGIYFDTGKSELKAESRPQLEQMSKVLMQNSTLKIYIVGHTDNQGSLDANVLLSQRRADAVVAALVRDFEADAKRLIARGVASLAPLAANSDETGRALNRRVELVTQ